MAILKPMSFYQTDCNKTLNREVEILAIRR